MFERAELIEIENKSGHEVFIEFYHKFAHSKITAKPEILKRLSMSE